MRGLIFGASGLLGRALQRELERRREPFLAMDHRAADITDPAQVVKVVRWFEPDVLYNCAAFTRVDDCEAHAELAREVNGRAVAHLAVASRSAGAMLVQVSTDYVFDGAARAPYVEEAEVAPLQEYGRSKLLGEREALRWERSVVVRTSWLFSACGPSFAATMVRLLAHGGQGGGGLAGEQPVRVVDDQVGCPTYAPFLARALADLAARGARGVVHYRNADAVSWHGFAAEIARRVAPGRAVVPVSTAEFPRPARRPAYSVLDVERFEAIVGRPVEAWRDGLDECLPELLAAARSLAPKT
ncbi:MAG TPA: dTDP-4-dehydrorhamnose reductase [Thermoanaerobaculia bacterium]|nr:dTDP-4-dehydrorhamnose reductase [Thermoanaerobaculia bacterium]